MAVFVYIMFDSCADYFKGVLTKKTDHKEFYYFSTFIYCCFFIYELENLVLRKYELIRKYEKEIIELALILFLYFRIIYTLSYFRNFLTCISSSFALL